MNNETILQGFEWYLPDDSKHWNRLYKEADRLQDAGITMVWLPPAYKGAAGASSVGYDVYDTYDLGEFDQKGSIPTKYGTKDEYISLIKNFHKHGIKVLADVVLNHMMGADGVEAVNVIENSSYNHDEQISGVKQIDAWTKFTFEGRAGKYSNDTWNVSNFSGTDWDESAKRNGIFCFEGKSWNKETDIEKGNFDYLMGADLDTDNADTISKVIKWGKWYFDIAQMDGLRLDAVKHISFEFYRNYLSELREYKGENFFAVGEYWSPDIGRLMHYLDRTNYSMSLFDVPLHFAFQRAATSDGNFDMGSIRENTLVKMNPNCSVTFVDNHDTQPGQALSSYIPAWFKRHAYAQILLWKNGIPCVFYGDYYGIPHDNIEPVKDLDILCKVRKLFAYGEECDYYDDSSVVGFTRSGDSEHENSGVAVLLTDKLGGCKRMYVSDKFAGEKFVNVLNEKMQPVIIGEDGCGEFNVYNGDVSVWIRELAASKL